MVRPSSAERMHGLSGLRAAARAIQWRSTSGPIALVSAIEQTALERDDFSSRRHPALICWWSMIFSENRFPLFGIMLYRPRYGQSSLGVAPAPGAEQKQ